MPRTINDVTPSGTTARALYVAVEVSTKSWVVGISTYLFVDERHLLWHSLVISAADRESIYVIDGLMQNDVVKAASMWAGRQTRRLWCKRFSTWPPRPISASGPFTTPSIGKSDAVGLGRLQGRSDRRRKPATTRRDVPINEASMQVRRIHKTANPRGRFRLGVK